MTCFLHRRPEGNPLDLNNLPDDFTRDHSHAHGKQLLQDTFSTERETETLNHARQLVFRSDHTLAAQAPPHLGCCQPIVGGGGDPTAGARRFPRYFSASSTSSTHIPTPAAGAAATHQPYLYASPSRPAAAVSFPPPHHHQFPPPPPPPHDYYVGHVLSTAQQQQFGHHYAGGAADSSAGGTYTCIGAPVVGQGGGKEIHGHGQQEGSLNWGRSSSSTSGSQPHHRLDPASAINRFQDGF
ncbi:hypothetical protein PIB30_029146 [Stylosanthes scabra]|uniref:Uncharacterized protein n=1 Tax=Stylosanthes scabra TaxID=79078 RepID=A0ABU6XCY2_9FABA|nr:hypothetical protein [Stylosanthes scabra]